MTTSARSPSTPAPDLLAGLVARVSARIGPPPAPPVLIGIAGVPGAGKTTLAQALTTRLRAQGQQAVHVPMDGFHLADVALDGLGLRGRKGAQETFDPAGYASLLIRIRAGDAVWAPAFDRELEQPIAQSIAVPAGTAVVVSEGNYLLLEDDVWRRVRAQFDEVWFCHTDSAVRLPRLVARHVNFGKSADDARDWVQAVDEGNAALVQAAADRADVHIDLTGCDLTR